MDFQEKTTVCKCHLSLFRVVLNCILLFFFHISFHSPSHQPLTLSPTSHPHPGIERLCWISESTTALQIYAFCFPFSLSLLFFLYSLLRRQWCRQTEREDIRWCTTRLERKNGGETAKNMEGDILADMREKLIRGEHQLEGTVMGLFASPRHPKNITISHHVYPLLPQDHSSHKPWLETAYILKGVYGWGKCWQCLQT